MSHELSRYVEIVQFIAKILRNSLDFFLFQFTFIAIALKKNTTKCKWKHSNRSTITILKRGLVSYLPAIASNLNDLELEIQQVVIAKESIKQLVQIESVAH